MNKTSLSKNKKNVFKALLVSGMVASPLINPINAYAATSILDAPNASLPADGEKADQKYEFIAQFNPELTEVKTFGGTWQNVPLNNVDKNTDLFITTVSPDDSLKGKGGVIYTNIGIYDGRQLDLKITLADWTSVYKNGAGRVSFQTDDIAMVSAGYDDVKMQWQLIDHETQKPVKVNGYMTITDIDQNQKMTLSADTMSHIDKIYVPTNDTKVSYNLNSDKSADFYSEFNGNNGQQWSFDPADPNERRGDFTFLYSDSDTLDITWGGEYAQDVLDKKAQESPSADEIINGAFGAYFSYSAYKPVATEILQPTKLVNDADEKLKATTSLTSMYENLSYEVTHTIPMETEDFYYESYQMVDTLNGALQLNGDVKIVDETNKDVTNRFDVKVEGQKITAEAKGDFVLSPDFYNHTYKYMIPAKVKADADLSAILKDGVYTVPNTASTYIDGQESTSNLVTSKLTPTETRIDKGIVSATDTMVDRTERNRDEEYKYRIVLDTTNNPTLKTLVLKDDLVDELDVLSAKILDAEGKDITDQGKLEIDEQKEIVTWTPDNSAEFIGKKLVMEITSKVKADADLEKYKTSPEFYTIPNTATAIQDGEPLDSDKVMVAVPVPKEAPTTEAPTTEKPTTEALTTEAPTTEKPTTEAPTTEAPSYTLGDTVWNDADKDGTVDEDEKGIPNASVEVQDKDGKVVATAKSDENGKYQIPDLPAGEYTVTFTAPEGYTPVDQTKVTQTIKLDKDNMDVDLGLFIPPVPKAPTETTIDKSVLEDDGKAVDSRNVELGKDYLYNVDTVITDSKEITKLVLSDDLEDVLDLKSAKVLNAEGKDITDQGDLAVDEEKEVIIWAAKDAKAYAGQTLKLVIDSQVKADADLKDYTADGKTVIPNTAKVTVDDKSTDSDKVDVIVPVKEEPKVPTETTIDKSVLEDDGKAVDSRNVEIGKDYLYNVNTVITDSKEITKLILSDDLEDVLDLKSAKVLNAEGKDITDQGDLAVDEEKEVITWTAKDAKAYAGQTLKLVIDSQVKTDADLKDYTVDGKTVIPNTAKVTVDDKSTDSDKVDVIVPMKEVLTTEEPTTEAPTTEEPTTEEPTTEAPTTEPPTTETPVEVITQEQAPTKKPEKVQSKPQTVIQKALPFTGTTEQRWMKSLAYLLVGMGVITGIVFYRKRKIN